MSATMYGPLKVPQVGRDVVVYLRDGELATGTVADHYEDGTGYVLAPWDDMVDLVLVESWRYTDG